MTRSKIHVRSIHRRRVLSKKAPASKKKASAAKKKEAPVRFSRKRRCKHKNTVKTAFQPRSKYVNKTRGGHIFTFVKELAASGGQSMLQVVRPSDDATTNYVVKHSIYNCHDEHRFNDARNEFVMTHTIGQLQHPNLICTNEHMSTAYIAISLCFSSVDKGEGKGEGEGEKKWVALTLRYKMDTKDMNSEYEAFIYEIEQEATQQEQLSWFIPETQCLQLNINTHQAMELRNWFKDIYTEPKQVQLSFDTSKNVLKTVHTGDMQTYTYTPNETVHGWLEQSYKSVEGAKPFKKFSFVMPYIQGIRLSECKTLFNSQVRKSHLVRGIISGLQQMHANKIAHRDITEKNIIITLNDRDEVTPVIIDYGFSICKESSTKDIFMCGTPGSNISPERDFPYTLGGKISRLVEHLCRQIAVILGLDWEGNPKRKHKDTSEPIYTIYTVRQRHRF